MRCRIEFSHVIVFSTVFLLLDILSPITVAAAGVKIQDVLEGIEYNESLVKSGKGTLIVKGTITEAGKQYFVERLKATSKGTPPPGIMVPRSYSIVSEAIVSYSFSGKKFRYDIKATNREWLLNAEQEHRLELELAYDGETLAERKISLKDISVKLDSGPFALIQPWLDPRYWGIATQNRSLAERIASMNPELIGTETLEGDLCYVIQPAPSPQSLGKTTKIWINPQKGYALQKIEFSSAKGFNTTNNQFKEVSKGIWVPYNEKYREFLVDPVTGSRTLSLELTREIKDFAVNVKIPDDVFKLVFEKGTEVFDARTKTSYIVE